MSVVMILKMNNELIIILIQPESVAQGSPSKININYHLFYLIQQLPHLIEVELPGPCRCWAMGNFLLKYGPQKVWSTKSKCSL